MSFNVSLYNDNRLSFNVKYRSGALPGNAVFSATAVNIGNFSNHNLYVDNNVELSVPYNTAVNCNVIKINNVIGIITDWEYINDNNTRISYVVDSFMSARNSGMISSLNGLCERVHMTVRNQFTNMQSEPFSPSDNTVYNEDLTTQLNSFVQGFEGMLPSWNSFADGSTSFILTVSNAVMEYLGVNDFTTPPTGFAQELKEITTLDFYRSDSVIHAGGTFRGHPLVFTQMQQVTTFINQLLGGCGFRTVLPPNGYSNQQADTHRQYVLDANNGGGQTNIRDKNYDSLTELSDPIESIRFINSNDIYNLYLIPSTFATATTSIINGNFTATGTKSIYNMHRWDGESIDKAKLLAYPFYYAKVITANGDTYNIIPQTHVTDVGEISAQAPAIHLHLRFIGGDSPRLMGRFRFKGDPTTNGDPGNTANAAEWFTVRNYPAIALSVNNSYSIQAQRDIANTRKISAVYTNGRFSAQLSNPIQQGYVDTVNGQNTQNTAQSVMQRFMGGVGSLLANIDQFGASLGFGNPQNAGLFEDKGELAAWNERRSIQAGNFVTPDQTTLMGNDFMSQYSVNGFSAFDCGATDTELFSFSRYIDEFGQSCNCILNPLTNVGGLFGGEASVITVNGRTFYQFSHIEVLGSMPIQWRNNIKALFESGVYLI